MHKFDLMKEKLKLSYAGNEFDRVIEFNCFFLDINANCVFFLIFLNLKWAFMGLPSKIDVIHTFIEMEGEVCDNMVIPCKHAFKCNYVKL